ncbi:MAG: hypothetical protein IPG76_12135 [Acidobacteria bacterium]|nr:hypothetical protein [Acidobacteriota bacterium]
MQNHFRYRQRGNGRSLIWRNTRRGAAVLGVSTATVRNDWNIARAWLRQEMTW